MKSLKVIALVVAGYVLGGALGYMAVQAFSSNRHDRDLEAAMTGAFVAGPAGAIVGLVIGLIVFRRRKSAT